MTRARHIASLICNVLVIVLVAFSVVSFFFRTGDGNMAVAGTRCFRFFTIDSNILCALTCALVLPFNVRGLRAGETVIPTWVLTCKFIGTTAVTLTFLVVMGFLGPILGYGAMFSGNNLFLHGICPILAMVSFLFAEGGALRFRTVWLALLPTLVYGLVYMTMVVIVGESAGGWPDFYMFNATGMWPLTFVALMLVTFAIAALLRLPHREKKRKG